MTKQDLLTAATDESIRFQKWFAWVLPEEIEIDSTGNIRLENQHDGVGLTEAGLEQRDDGLTVVNGACTNPPEWFVSKYVCKYWNGVRAGELPNGVGEAVANFNLNTGRGIKFLQLALNERGIAVSVDNQMGLQTLGAAWKDPDSKDLGIAVCKEAISYYNSISHNYPPEDLEDWLRRTQDIQDTFLS